MHETHIYCQSTSVFLMRTEDISLDALSYFFRKSEYLMGCTFFKFIRVCTLEFSLKLSDVFGKYQPFSTCIPTTIEPLRGTLHVYLKFFPDDIIMVEQLFFVGFVVVISSLKMVEGNEACFCTGLRGPGLYKYLSPEEECRKSDDGGISASELEHALG
jgi:hypothetical protein